MENKHEFGSPVSVSEYIERENFKKHMYLAFAIVETAILLWHGYSLGAYRVRVISIIGAIVAAVALFLSITCYGSARERVLFGKIIMSDGIVIEIDNDGNTVVTTKIENVINEEKEDGHGQ